MDPSLRFNPKKLEEARKKGDSLETPIWPNDIKLLPMPIWWVEGIAEYFSSDYRAQQEDAPFLKDAVLHNYEIIVPFSGDGFRSVRRSFTVYRDF